MWWWQSVALPGAFDLGVSVPAENFTGPVWVAVVAVVALAHPASIPAAASDIVFSTSRRSMVIASSPLALRQAQHALAQDVALDIAGAGRDRVLPGGHDAVEPARRVGHDLGAHVDQCVHAEQLAGRIGDAHADLGARELQDRALRPRWLAADLAGERAVARVLHRLAVDEELREALADLGIVPRGAAFHRQPARDGDEVAHLAERVAG